MHLSSFSLLLVVASTLAGCKPSQAAPVEHHEEAVHVDTIAAREQPMPRSLLLTGTLKGDQQVSLAANAVGRVVATFVERGTAVKKGDIIAKLDVRSAALSAAEAGASAELARVQASTAQRECKRYKELMATNAISEAEFDRVSDTCRTSAVSIEVAKAHAEAAALAVSDGTVRAPFDGVVTERFVQAGEYVHVDSRVASIATVSALRLEITVPEANLADVKRGGALTFNVSAYPDRSFSGTIRFVGTAVRESTRDLVAEALVDNADGALLPGMFATVQVQLGKAPAVVIPRKAILEKDGLSRVLVVARGRVEERLVRTGAIDGDFVAIASGLANGDNVVAQPTDAIHNGQAVN
jgi:RND family efflux transporter MFP subunit